MLETYRPVAMCYLGRLAYLFVAQRFVTKFDKVKIAYMVYFYNKRFCNIGLYCDIYDK